ncbi:MAG: IclR family transcriptional regulator [Deltaproteobacteria bacterium]|nr:IclR family transcriptional regulator [Deltaproteobacteria bacterium]
MVRREKSNYMIQAVAHALDVLEQFYGDGELGVTELSKRLKLHKNNVFRILATLESRGYIEQNRSTENYRLGTKCLQLGQTYIQHMGLLQQARPIMLEVVKACHESTYVTVMRKGQVVPLDMVESDQPVRIVSHIGENLPLHCTAPGKVHLAFEPAEELQRCFSEGLAQYTTHTITDRNVLAEQLKAVTTSGYAVDSGEYLTDVRSVAAPIKDYTRTVVGSLAVSGPAYRIPPERIEQEIVPLVIKAGRELSSRLGYNT